MTIGRRKDGRSCSAGSNRAEFSVVFRGCDLLVDSSLKYMPSRRKKKFRSVVVRGQRYLVRDVLHVGGREYAVIRRLTEPRERYLVFDRTAGLRGDLRALHFYPMERETFERLRVLERLRKDARLPALLDVYRERTRVAALFTWVDGVSLDRYMEPMLTGRRERPSPRVAIAMIRNLCHAVRTVNEMLNVVHGDIKPANIVSPRGHLTNLTLIDFGSAWCVERSVVQAGLGDGITVAVYASPEQRQTVKLPDFRSDMFSVGVIGYELLTAQTPYDGMGGGAGSTPEHASAYAGTMKPPSTFRITGDMTPGDVWMRLDGILDRCLELNPERRYGGWTDMLRDVDEVYALTLRQERIGSRWEWLFERIASVVNRLWRNRPERDD